MAELGLLDKEIIFDEIIYSLSVILGPLNGLNYKLS